MFGTQSEGGRACFGFPCHCFCFLAVPDFCWCNVQVAEVKGKLRLEGNRAIPLFLHMGRSCCTFPKHTETDDMVKWVSKAWKTNSGTDSSTGKHLTSRPSPHPIMCSGILQFMCLCKEQLWEEHGFQNVIERNTWQHSMKTGGYIWLIMCQCEASFSHSHRASGLTPGSAPSYQL